MLQLRRLVVVFVLLLVPALDAGAVSVTLKGSPASVERQNRVAKELGYSFIETGEQVADLVDAEELVPVRGDANYDVLPGVSYKYARPEMRLFIERLAEQYHDATGEKLVVTSLTRPSSEQPRNAHPLSVHPTGMAVDLRISASAQSRAWIESVLLRLERQGVLDVTRERYPPHYHVALFPEAYRGYVEAMIGPHALATALIFVDEEELAEEQEIVRAADAIIARDTAAAASPVTAAAGAGNSVPWKLLAVIPWVLLPVAFFLGKLRARRRRTVIAA